VRREGVRGTDREAVPERRAVWERGELRVESWERLFIPTVALSPISPFAVAVAFRY